MSDFFGLGETASANADRKKKKSLRMKSKGLFKSKQTKNTTTYRQQRVKRLQMWNEQYQ